MEDGAVYCMKPMRKGRSEEEKVAVMQPYLFPYIGYFQLINLVDQFVVYDDVQWMKGGWINRNRILEHGHPAYITFPLRKASYKAKIKDREFSLDFEAQKASIFSRIQSAYRRAPYFEPTLTMLSKCLASTDRNVARFAVNALHECCSYLGITTPFVLSSELVTQENKGAEVRVLEINRLLGATHYINPAGGRELYNKEHFAQANIELIFIEPRIVPYSQFGEGFLPSLSILDAMMFNSKRELEALLSEYDLS